MKIEAGKFYKTRDGQKARVYALDACGDYPVHGAVLCNDGMWILSSWTCGGHDDAEGPASSNDIVAEWTAAPKIHWGRIPDYVDSFSLDIDGGIESGGRYVFGYESGDDFAFPNWRDFIGQSFERPKA